MNAQLLWQSRDILLERFRAAPQDPAPEVDGPVAARPAIAFPRAPVRIEPEERPAFVADPTVAVLHNPGERHRRRALSGRADVCDRISLAPEILFEVRPDLARSWGRPFHATHVPCPARAYLLLRHAVWYAESESAVPALLEEAILRLVEMVVGRQAPGGKRLAKRPTAVERRMVEKAKELLVADPGERHTLDSIALHVGCSPYHLSRVFRRATGRTPHAYLTHLRLRESLPRVLEPGSDLAAVAFETGFSSHSHFTATFRQTFGITPSRLRLAAGSVTPAMLRRLLADSRRQAII